VNFSRAVSLKRNTHIAYIVYIGRLVRSQTKKALNYISNVKHMTLVRLICLKLLVCSSALLDWCQYMLSSIIQFIEDT